MITKKIIKDTVIEAAKKTTPKKVILFGSYAHGKPNKDSDVDLLFVKNTNLSGLKRYCWISNNINHIFPMDILVKTPLEIKKRLAMGDPFYKSIMRNGEILYESGK